ncbi:hypothetical protein BTA51_08375 [Hahella sp. CCB-MM4]|uniref:response regulator n=1 Tax=Hahella sp. (strain CCB-MM4) TaxID=1926491 RepID=UPI000B9ADB49|nr:response regulator [Hahella sp. CCB-MM4]OZG73813.1 hypothetical protein BTA51_08375 [Hahella sp. CCB-MM4]
MSLQTALVVDDSKLARITLQRLLQKHNLQVELAESGVQAIEMLESTMPDIIFMDHLMPELDGFEATKKIKANPSTAHIPVIMCTGKEGVDNYDEQARGIGASGTLSKPPQPDQLSIVLAAAQSGENLVSHRIHEPAASVNAANINNTAHEEPAAPQPAQQSAGHEPAHPSIDLKEVIDRLVALEHKKTDLPSFDAFESRLSSSESSIAGLQDAMIALKESVKDSASEPATEQFESFQSQLDSLGQQLSGIRNELPQADSLRSDIEGGMEGIIQERIASALADFKTALENSQEKPDSREITSKVVQEVEEAITPLLEEEIRNLEKRLSVTIDEAVSESRKDLDDQLSESIKEAELKAKPIPGEPDLDNLIERIRADISDIATHTATAAVDVNLEDRLADFKEQINKARADIQNVAQSAAAKADIGDIISNPKLETMIEGTVEEMLRVQISKQGQELVQQIAKALREQTEEKQQEFTDMAAKLEAVEQSNIELVTKISDLEEQNLAPTKSSSSNSGGIVLGGAALVTAVVAVAKAFGLF